MRRDGAAAVILNAIDPHRCSNPLLMVYLAHELGHIMSDASDGGQHIVIDREEEKRPARTASSEANSGREPSRPSSSCPLLL